MSHYIYSWVSRRNETESFSTFTPLNPSTAQTIIWGLRYQPPPHSNWSVSLAPSASNFTFFPVQTLKPLSSESSEPANAFDFTTKLTFTNQNPAFLTIIISVIVKQGSYPWLRFVGTWKIPIPGTSNLIGLGLSLGSRILKVPRWFLCVARVKKHCFKKSHLLISMTSFVSANPTHPL